MIISNAEYRLSAVKPEQYPADGLKEIALVGRSNVGKSSLINKFSGRKNLARTSGVPGKTRTLNFYRVNNLWYFVDLPGYGYAKAGHQEKERWGKFIDEYLRERNELYGVIQVVDIRHPPSGDDFIMYEWIRSQKIPYIIAATKADKISRGNWRKHSQMIIRDLGIEDESSLIHFSALTGQGVEQLSDWIDELLKLD